MKLHARPTELALTLLLACTLSAAGGFFHPSRAASEPPRTQASFSPPQAEASDVFSQMHAMAASLNDRTAPSIVTVTAYERLPEGQAPPTSPSTNRWVLSNEEYPGFRVIGAGSGFVLGEAGDVLTNRHFLLKPDGTPADLVDVETVDNRHTISRIAGMEPTLNLAVVRLEVFTEGNPPRFEPLEFANSGELYPGHLVFLHGDPFGPDKFFAQGYLAATPSRLCYQEQLTAAYLQVISPMHRGAFGGALLDPKGRFVGMLTPRDPMKSGSSLDVDTDLHYALPSNIILGLYKTIARNATFESPWLGFAVMSLAELRRELGSDGVNALQRPRVGIYLENVFAPSPAFDAGIRPGDFLVSLNGVLIGSPLEFQHELYLAGPGSTVELVLSRDGAEFEVRLDVEVRPDEAVTR